MLKNPHLKSSKSGNIVTMSYLNNINLFLKTMPISKLKTVNNKKVFPLLNLKGWVLKNKIKCKWSSINSKISTISFVNNTKKSEPNMKESIKKIPIITSKIINSLPTTKKLPPWLLNSRHMSKSFNIKMISLKSNKENPPLHIKIVSLKIKPKRCIFISPKKSKDTKKNSINTDTLLNNIKKKSNSIDNNLKKSVKLQWKDKTESSNFKHKTPQKVDILLHQ